MSAIGIAALVAAGFFAGIGFSALVIWTVLEDVRREAETRERTRRRRFTYAK